LELENARQRMLEGEAAVAAAQAAVREAELNVQWCTVTAPISGRISRKLVTPGNLVNGGTGTTTLLTTITAIDPIYCYVEADERSVLRYQQLAREKKRVSARDTPIPCFLGLSNESDFPHEGVIDFVDNRIDPDTGTLRARGVVANPNGYLLPGMFARMRVPGSGRYRALLVPDAAVGSDQNQKFLLVVRSDGTVEYRSVKLGALFEGARVIDEGINLDDRVVINGIQRARPGTRVNASEVTFEPDIQLTAPGSPATRELPPAIQSAPTTATKTTAPTSTAPVARSAEARG
jgi:RND family efflux transporter MFP subunit